MSASTSRKWASIKSTSIQQEFFNTLYQEIIPELVMLTVAVAAVIIVVVIVMRCGQKPNSPG